MQNTYLPLSCPLHTMNVKEIGNQSPVSQTLPQTGLIPASQTISLRH